MVTSNAWISLLTQHRAIAVIRSANDVIGIKMAKAVAKAGMRLIEITWNSASAASQIQQLRDELPHCTIGTGTVLTSDHLDGAIASGAQFIFTPHVNTALIDRAASQNIPIIPGAFSPTEIVTAWQAGAPSVKIFPVEAVGGVNYIRSLQGPLGHIPMIPTGGVTLQNAGQFIEAGAIAVGLSSQLFPNQAIATRDWELITRRTQTLLQNVPNRGSHASSLGASSRRPYRTVDGQ